MALFLPTDTFTGSDGTTVQVYSANWTKHASSGGDAKIYSNMFSADTGGTRALYYNNATPGSADYYVNAQIYAGGRSGSYEHLNHIAGRMSTSANTYYSARHYSTSVGTLDNWELYKTVAGAFTQLGSSSAQVLTAGQLYSIELRMVGSAIALRKEGGTSDLISATDSAITDAGKAGIRFSTTFVTTRCAIDNFYALDTNGSVFARASSRQRHLLVR